MKNCCTLLELKNGTILLSFGIRYLVNNGDGIYFKDFIFNKNNNGTVFRMTGLEILKNITVVWFHISLGFFVGTENESGTNKFIYLFCFCSGFSERARTSILYIYFLQVMQRVDFMTNEFGLSFLFL